MTEHTDTPDPAVTRVLHAMTDRLHESLCNCRNYPDACASRDDYRRDDLVHTFGHAEEALEEALKQGWTPAAAVTPPVAGETTEAAVLDVAEAIHRAFQASSTDGWDHEARAAIAAYRPHLTAERDAETTALRAQVHALRNRIQRAEYHLGEIEMLTSELDGDGSRALAAADVERVYLLAGDAALALADPAPSTPAAQENQT